MIMVMATPTITHPKPSNTHSIRTSYMKMKTSAPTINTSTASGELKNLSIGNPINDELKIVLRLRRPDCKAQAPSYYTVDSSPHNTHFQGVVEPTILALRLHCRTYQIHLVGRGHRTLASAEWTEYGAVLVLLA